MCRPRPRVSILVAALVLAAPASAQRAELLRFLAQRPLHARLAAADAVAIGTIERVEPGRIHVGRAEFLLGPQGASFAIKRAPSSPPPLEAGDRALLLLRGARSPYLLVDAGEELVVFTDAAAAGRWAAALRGLLAARGQPRQLALLYVTFLDWADPELQRAAVLGLDDRTAGFHPLPASALQRMVEIASDPGRGLELRRAAAFVAGRSARGQRGRAADAALLEALARLDAELF